MPADQFDGHQLRRDLAAANESWKGFTDRVRQEFSTVSAQQELKHLAALYDPSVPDDPSSLRRAIDIFVKVLDRHPGADGWITRASRPIFPDQRGYSRDIAAEVGRIFGAAAITLDLAALEAASLVYRLLGIVSGVDELNTLFRQLLLGKPIGPTPPSVPRELQDLVAEVTRRTCVQGVLSAFVQFGQAVASWKVSSNAKGITGLAPADACQGDIVSILGSGFGATQPRNTEIYFPNESGGCTRAEIVRWGDTEIRARVPQGVGVGCVGFVFVGSGGGTTIVEAALTLAGELGNCLGPMASASAQTTLGKLATAGGIKIACPPCLPRSRNLFRGGPPVIRMFQVNGSTSFELPRLGLLDLSWTVERATSITITPAGINNQLHELPPVSGPLDPQQGSWIVTSNNPPSNPNPLLNPHFNWDAVYMLTATNACGSTTAPVEVHSRSAGVPASPPTSFLWGVATAGRQVEGNLKGDDWAVLTEDAACVQRLVACAAKAGGKWNPQPAEIALDHWNLLPFAEAVDRAKALGLNAYRFSVEWSRIEPTRGKFNAAALATYQVMVNHIRSRSIEPIVVLCHLSLPAWILTPPRQTAWIGGPLQIYPSANDGDPDYKASLRGWETQDTVDEFRDYVEFVVSGLTGVTWWITFNEPLATLVAAGYMAGVFPPGFAADEKKGKAAIHNIINAHVHAFDRIRSLNGAAQVGITDQWLLCKSTLDAGITAQFVYYHQDYLLNALIDGNEDLDIAAGSTNIARVMGIAPGDWTPKLTFFGLQYYKSGYPEGLPWPASAGFLGGKVELDLTKPGYTHQLLNDMGWEMCPEGLHTCLMKLHARMSLPILIAENGTAEIADHNRSAYITSHLEQMQRAVDDGANVIGYLHWSIADNWEWIDSYRKEARFGLFSVDRSNPALTHSITDGALAMSVALHEPPATIPAAVERFGRYKPDASTVEHPVKSPFSVWEGDLDGELISLLIAAPTSPVSYAGGPAVGWLGMIFYGISRRWLRLDTVAWDATTRTLQVSHPGVVTSPAVPARVIVGKLDSLGGAFSGLATDHSTPPAAARPWQASKVRFAGMWQAPATTAGGGPTTFSIGRVEGRWVGRVLRGADWTVLGVSDNPSGLVATDNGMFMLLELSASVPGIAPSITEAHQSSGGPVVQTVFEHLQDGVPF